MVRFLEKISDISWVKAMCVTLHSIPASTPLGTLFCKLCRAHVQLVCLCLVITQYIHIRFGNLFPDNISVPKNVFTQQQHLSSDCCCCTCSCFSLSFFLPYLLLPCAFYKSFKCFPSVLSCVAQISIVSFVSPIFSCLSLYFEVLLVKFHSICLYNFNPVTTILYYN